MMSFSIGKPQKIGSQSDYVNYSSSNAFNPIARQGLDVRERTAFVGLHDRTREAK